MQLLNSVLVVLFCILVAIGDSALIYRSPDNYGHKSMVTLKGTHLTHSKLNNDDTYKSKGIIREPFFIVVSARHAIRCQSKFRSITGVTYFAFAGIG